MKRLILMLVLTGAMTAPVFATDPAPPVPMPVPSPVAPYVKLPTTVTGDAGDFIEVAADTNGTTVRWRVLDAGLHSFPITRLKDTKTGIFTSNTPGKYRVIAWTASNGEPSAEAETTIIINGTAPPPPPGPGPQPQPPAPVSYTPPLYYIAIIVTTNPDPAAAKVIESATMQGVKTKNKLYILSKTSIADSLDIQNHNYDKVMAKLNLTSPCLLIFDSSSPSKTLAGVPFPKTEADLASLIKGLN